MHGSRSTEGDASYRGRYEAEGQGRIKTRSAPRSRRGRHRLHQRRQHKGQSGEVPASRSSHCAPESALVAPTFQLDNREARQILPGLLVFFITFNAMRRRGKFLGAAASSRGHGMSSLPLRSVDSPLSRRY